MTHKIKKFYFNEVMNSFDQKSHNYLYAFFEKYEWETKNILKIIKENNIKNPKIVDVGGGLGIPSLILSKLYGFDCSLVDRFDEFDKSLEREVGSEVDVKLRLKNFDVKVYCDDFIENRNPLLQEKFDIVTNFSVIEHIPISPIKVFESLEFYVKKNGHLFLTTPNQAHIFNRLKLFIGMNVWEDISTFIDNKNFYGHVREYLLKELKFCIFKLSNLNLLDSGGSNHDMYPYLNRKFGKRMSKFLLGPILELCTLNISSLKLHIYVNAKKK